MARLPQNGGDNGVWGDVLNQYLLVSHTTDGSLKAGVVEEQNLAPAVQTKLNATGADAVLLTGPQTVEGEKTFENVVRSNAFLIDNTSDSTIGGHRMYLGGGPYPGLGVDSGPNSPQLTRIATNPATGSMALDYAASMGGNFTIRSSPVTQDVAFEIDENGNAEFTGTLTAPVVNTTAIRISGGSPGIGKLLTSDIDGNATWQNASGLGTGLTRTKLEDLYDPIVGIIPSDEILQDNYDIDNFDATHYDVLWGTRWDSPNINTQSMQLVEAFPGVPAAGCVNKPNGRDVGSCHDFEFEFTGDKLALQFQMFGYFDTQVYVEHEGQMMKIKTYPMTGTHEGYVYRSIRFSKYATRRIRVVAPFVFFCQVIHEISAVIHKTPDRPMIAITGDSYVDGSSSYNSGSSRSYITSGIVDTIIEATGFAVVRLGQGGTGYFNNGTGAASDAFGPVNSSRFFSANRLAALQAYGMGKIKALIVNGTINDGPLSGGTAGMLARASEGYQALNAWDPDISIIAVTPEPINNPQAGNDHDQNRQGIIQAINSHPQGIGVIDTYNPAKPLWTGTGTEASPAADQQSKLVGMDGIHGNWAGYQLYGHHIAMNIAQMKLYDS